MIIVKEVQTKKQQKQFIDFPLNLYKGNQYFVPALYADEKAIFKKNYHYYKTSKAVYFLAYKDEKVVGRISAILQRSSNEKWNQKRVRFTRFDCIDDQEVANALFDAAVDFAKKENMEEIVGPLGFSDLEREGLLIEGFDYLSTFEEQYNYPYYQKLIENYGFEKEVDWLEHRLFYSDANYEKLEKVSQMLLDRFHLKFVKVKSVRWFIKKYIKQFFEIIDTTYDKIYGTVPITPEIQKSLISSFKMVVTPKHIVAIVDENDKIVAFALTFPAIGKDLQKSGGRITIPTLFKLLKTIHSLEYVDLGLVGVIPEYEMKGVASAIFAMCLRYLKNGTTKYYETNLNLEDNHHIINQWHQNFEYIQHKRRRCYVKKI